MIWSLESLMRSANENHALIDGRYVPARPLPGFWLDRVRAAWAVLMGTADAVRWPGNQ